MDIHLKFSYIDVIKGLRIKVLFDDAFYREYNIPMSEEQRKILMKADYIFREIYEENKEKINSLITDDKLGY